jgi:hypothetical protein
MADPQVLDLSTAQARPQVRIDGRVYEQRLPSDFSLFERIEIAKLGEQVAPMLKVVESGATPSKRDQQVFGELLEAICEKAIIAPRKVIAKVDQADQLLVVVTFYERLAPSLQALSAMMLRRGTGSPGQKRSPASPGSTAATRFSGRPGFRSASSKRT